MKMLLTLRTHQGLPLSGSIGANLSEQPLSNIVALSVVVNWSSGELSNLQNIL